MGKTADLRTMQPYPLKTLSSALGSEVIMQYLLEPGKGSAIRIFVIKIGDQVLTYEAGSSVAGGWRLALLTDAGAKKRFACRQPGKPTIFPCNLSLEESM